MHQPTNRFYDTLSLEAEAIQTAQTRFQTPEYRKLLDELFEALTTRLEHSCKIIVTGVGKSGKIGQKIAATLSSTGSPAFFLHPTEGLHGDLGMVSEGDCVIAISHSGNSAELVELLPSLAQRNILLIGIGGQVQSKLARAADFWLDASVTREACPHNLAPTTSTTLGLAIGDALAMGLMERRGFGADHFAHNHPGGSLGRRLHLRVKSVLHSREEALALSEKASIQEVVQVLTSNRLGGVAIVDNDWNLKGLITDGDLRRALQSPDTFFSMKASDLMTGSPTTIQEDALAEEARQLMQDRPRPLNLLPVLDKSNKWVGIVRIHDL